MIKGVGTSFKLDNPTVLTEIAIYLDNIESSSDTDQNDGFVFQPGVSNPIKATLPGATTRGYSMSGVWSAAAETFFSAIEGMTGLDYEYGPDGTATGKSKISGVCACHSYSGPNSSEGITSFTVELSVTTRVVGVF